MKNKKIMELTKIAIIIALVLVLGLTPLGYIMIGMLQVTTIHVVVILVAIVFGLKYGVIAGATFGVTSIISAILTPGPFSPIFYNPLVSILPRILLGVVAYATFKFMMVVLKKMNSSKAALSISSAVSAAVSTLTHTIIVLVMISLFKGMSSTMTPEMLNASMITILSVNMPSEIILATVVATIAVPILYPYFNKDKIVSKGKEV